MTRAFVAGALLLLGLASCGARQRPAPVPCMSDRECRAERICHEGRCRFLAEVRSELSAADGRRA
ncbi:MAG: hypothetical protein AAF447_24195, partial [Myxococcota bacterium]